MTLDAIAIRAATEGDIPGISRLIRDLARRYITPEFTPHGAQQLLASMEERSIAGYFRLGYLYHVAEVADVLAGVVATRDDRHLYHLFVADEYQRRGLATRLWHVARDACLAAGNCGEFTVNASRFSAGFYERIGFVRQADFQEQDGVVSIPMKLVLAGKG